MHSIPGGLCTSWKRKGYTFDGCIAWLTGSAPDGWFFPIWQELGAIKNNRFIYLSEYCRFISRDNKHATIYTDIDKLKEELIRISPEDLEPINELCNMITRFKDFKPNVKNAVETMGITGSLKMLTDLLRNMQTYKNFFKYGKISISEFSKKFKNPLIRDMLVSIWDENIPVSLFAATMACYSNKTAGFPEGGSIKLASDIEKRYLGLGGKIRYKNKVDKIIVNDNKAVGIKLIDGTEEYSDIVISASDGHSTIFNMLEGRYVSDIAKECYLEKNIFSHSREC